MTNIPTTINGVPLTELIGKEVTVKFLSGRKPVEKNMAEQLKKHYFDILWDVKFNSLKGDFQLRFLMIHSNGKIKSSFSSYTCLYSNVELEIVKDGKFLDINTSDMQALLQALNKDLFKKSSGTIF
ncbi:hypothetical protein [Paenibacillus sp.]|jgi:hypothetical protein|uniref:hypothetical protein n=1 Tax=Paenibacillus sp. TaxID=58172 RepID=UPI002832000F|nr:hypothetical protein [Paenibacillus sp.]MDR0269849.1 hypothetical protein [Paenibacillus sp.]